MRFLLSLICLILLTGCNETKVLEKQNETVLYDDSVYFIVQRNRPMAFLFNRSGAILKQWQAETVYKSKVKAGWNNAKMTTDGGLIVINKDKELFKLDKNSQRVWSNSGFFHHDLQILPSGSILALNRKIDLVKIPKIDKHIHILNEYISEFTSDGEFVSEIELYSKLVDLIPQQSFDRILSKPNEKPVADSSRDIFHMNSIDIYYSNKSNQQNKLSCSDGSYLVSMRSISKLAIIDKETNKVCWESSKINLESQHDASFTSNNDLLVFNNRNPVESSQILLINPKTKEVLNSVVGLEDHKFYTASGGSAQLLDDQTYLIGVTDIGKIYHLDNKGKLIFQINNDFLSEQHDKFFRLRKINDSNSR